MERVSLKDLEFDLELGLVLHGNPFTGVVTMGDETSPFRGEEHFDNGERHGSFRERWTESGELSIEGHRLRGVLHGRLRRWYLDGTIAADEQYEHGIRVSGKTWNQRHILIENFRLDESYPEYARLTECRGLLAESENRTT